MLFILFSIFISVAFGLNIPEQNGFHRTGEFARDIGYPNSIADYNYNQNPSKQIYVNDFANQGIHSQGTIGHHPSSVHGQTNRNIEQVRVVKDEHSSSNTNSTHQSRNVGVVQKTGVEYVNRPYY